MIYSIKAKCYTSIITTINNIELKYILQLTILRLYIYFNKLLFFSLKNKLLQKTQGAHCALCANYSFGAEYPDRIGLLRKGKKLEK